MNKRAKSCITRCNLTGISVIYSLLVLIFALPVAVHTQSVYLSQWDFFYQGFSTLGSVYGCGVCHVPGSTNYTQFNPYGLDIQPCVAGGGAVDDCALLIEDIDSDGDGCLNFDEIEFDSHPGISNPGLCQRPCDDTDQDGICDDGDSSGVVGDNPCIGGDTVDCDDNCPFMHNPFQEDCDNDGIGDPCDIDDDGDGYDVISPAPSWDCNDTCLDANLDGIPDGFLINPAATEICGNAVDENCDGIVQPPDADRDGDLVPECQDNCPGLSNPSQTDLDGDGLGDECDNDMDGDGLLNTRDPASTMVPDGDVNRDGVVNAADVMMAMQIVNGVMVPDPVQGHMADVQPYFSGGVPNLAVDLADVLKISNMAGMGL